MSRRFIAEAIGRSIRTVMDPQKYREALEFALRAHEGQFRKGTDIPYITHPVSVSAILMQYGYGDDLAIAGLLHDVLEDTAVTPAELQEKFGTHIGSIVHSVTENKRDSEGRPRNWEVRKEGVLEHLRTSEEPVVVLKAADALHNVDSILRDIRVAGDAVWRRFNRGREHQLEQYRRLSGIIRERLADSPLAAELCETVDRLGRLADDGRTS